MNLICIIFLTFLIPLYQENQDQPDLPIPVQPVDIVLLHPYLVNIPGQVKPPEVMFGDDETIEIIKQLIHKSLDKGLNKAVASITERQDAIERRTEEQLESCRNLLLPLRHAIQERLSVSSEGISCTTGLASDVPSPPSTSVTEHSDDAGNSASSSTTASKVSCNFCAKTFVSITSLDSHIVKHHEALQCTICGKTLRSKPDLYLHTLLCLSHLK